MTRILVTGANGHLGRRLITMLPPFYVIEALVRSERARDKLLKNVGNRSKLNITVADPRDPVAIAELSSQCERVVHLIGTIKETRGSRYIDAHEIPARALVKATSRIPIKHIVYVSILGAAPDSPSRCLRSRAAVESLLMAAQPAATIIRVPMVLGEKDRASFALAKRASAKRVVLFRAGSLEQPIYAGDVVDAIATVLGRDDPQDQIFDLAGPESLSHRDLVTRAALLLNNSPTIYSLPIGFGTALAGLLEMVTARPPLTRGMLRVLDHDDAIDPTQAAAALGIRLTGLDEILRRCVINRLS